MAAIAAIHAFLQIPSRTRRPMPDPTTTPGKPSPAVFDIVSAHEYVLNLFRFVLDRTEVQEAELDHWAAHLLTTQDPAELLNKFGGSAENQSRLSAATTSRTGFPHGHFYSPVVDVSQFQRDKELIYRPRELLGIDLNVSAQRQRFAALRLHMETMPFSEEPDGKHRYHFNNTSFGFGDAAIYWSMLATLKPRRIMEIGSGYTSGLALDAIDTMGLDTVCTFIDPYPQLLLKVCGPIAERHTVLVQEVQKIDPEMVRELRPNDILFIDSSHVVKTGSDVHFELTELLPRLNPGVFVHFHDTFFPFEYPSRWIEEQRLSWNELYFIHCFLCWNSEFTIEFFNDFFVRTQLNELNAFAKSTRERLRLNPGGGLWIRRK
jgi:hypothetical protein